MHGCSWQETGQQHWKKGPVDGTCEYMSSLRAKLQGQLAILITVGFLANVYKITEGQVKTYCDNKGIVKCLNQGWCTTKLKMNNGAVMDLMLTINAIRCQSKWLKLKWTQGWVKGHQDSNMNENNLITLESLNVEMDKLADSAYEMEAERMCSTVVPVLLGEH